ncbi:YciI family protein [Gilvimarinus agarilyticus]|uniref:YciI family protein n=1 Tax=Gilvimarinus sp. 2_MG-2023 TaxID=3062666 RepID=UPI001C081211|nr:YciI family protein [Gilvimarinus sp. 2_MG-2023]MBU2886201.1 YciI family protein [Gilvimarinus agarilyticus]MDO6570889.1 YciI family protein [Gilvimarinus sp. 2_MG-2023]
MRYLILTLRTPNFDVSVIEGHKEYLAQLMANGVLELAGGFTDQTGGAYVIVAEDLESAQTIAFNDPVYTSGASDVIVHEWNAA